MERGEQVQMNIYQSNTYRKDLRWIHFDDEPRVSEQVKDHQNYISVFVAYPKEKTGEDWTKLLEKQIEKKNIWFTTHPRKVLVSKKYIIRWHINDTLTFKTAQLESNLGLLPEWSRKMVGFLIVHNSATKIRNEDK